MVAPGLLACTATSISVKMFKSVVIFYFGCFIVVLWWFMLA